MYKKPSTTLLTHIRIIKQLENSIKQRGHKPTLPELTKLLKHACMLEISMDGKRHARETYLNIITSYDPCCSDAYAGFFRSTPPSHYNSGIMGKRIADVLAQYKKHFGH